MSVNFSHNINQAPVQENAVPAKNSDCCGYVIVAGVALVIFGLIAAGITLTALGAVTANPVFLEIGIMLIVLPILATLSLIAKNCR